MNLEKKRKLALLFMAFVPLIFICVYYDAEIIRFFYQFKTPLLTEIFSFIGKFSSKVVIFSLLTCLFLWENKKRRWILPVWFSLALSVAISFILKISVQRLRPFQQGLVYLSPSLASPDFSTWNFSFPSFQTMMAFSAIPIICKNFPKLKYLWIILSCLIGLSRVYFGLHFLSDVLSGALIGLFIGELIVISEQKNKFWQRTYEKLFKK